MLNAHANANLMPEKKRTILDKGKTKWMHIERPIRIANYMQIWHYNSLYINLTWLNRFSLQRFRDSANSFNHLLSQLSSSYLPPHQLLPFRYIVIETVQKQWSIPDHFSVNLELSNFRINRETYERTQIGHQFYVRYGCTIEYNGLITTSCHFQISLIFLRFRNLIENKKKTKQQTELESFDDVELERKRPCYLVNNGKPFFKHQ